MGNVAFRHLVSLNKEIYQSREKSQKEEFAISLLNAIRSQDPPGRFLKQDPHTRLWRDVGDIKAVEKIRQALRENPSKKRRLSTDSDQITCSQNMCRMLKSFLQTLR